MVFHEVIGIAVTASATAGVRNPSLALLCWCGCVSVCGAEKQSPLGMLQFRYTQVLRLKSEQYTQLASTYRSSAAQTTQWSKEAVPHTGWVPHTLAGIVYLLMYCIAVVPTRGIRDLRDYPTCAARVRVPGFSLST